MLLDNAQSTVTYTSISSDSDGPSWGIPLMNADEILEIDPYKEVSQQGQVPPLSPAYVPDPIELDEHVPVYVLEPEQPEYHAPSDDDIQDDNEDPEEDPSEEHEPEDDDEDPNEEPEPEGEDTNEEELSEGSNETEPFEEDETAITPPPPRHRRARISVRPQTPMRRFVFTASAHGCDVAESSVVAAARAPRGQYDFFDTVEAGQCLICSPGLDARTIAKATDRAEDVCYVGALHASEHRMMTSIKETDHRDIRLKIDVVRGQRTAYETKLQEVRQAYLSFEARNMALLARVGPLTLAYLYPIN
nr:hypothetical protein [Tanacetum cinerariifolium]